MKYITYNCVPLCYPCWWNSIRTTQHLKYSWWKTMNVARSDKDVMLKTEEQRCNPLPKVCRQIRMKANESTHNSPFLSLWDKYDFIGLFCIRHSFMDWNAHVYQELECLAPVEWLLQETPNASCRSGWDPTLYMVNREMVRCSCSYETIPKTCSRCKCPRSKTESQNQKRFSTSWARKHWKKS